MKKLIAISLLAFLLVGLTTRFAPAPLVRPTPINKTKGTATVTVAASDASAAIKRRADYICTGTNDEVEIKAAYDSLTETIGGTIHLSAGVFEIGSTLAFDTNTPVALEGEGFLSYWPAGTFYPAGTVIKLSDNANCTLLEFSGGWSCGKISGIWFEGNKANNAAPGVVGVSIKNKGDLKIDHCMFHGFAHVLTLALDNHGSWVVDCDFEENTGKGIYVQKGAQIETGRNWIENCYFSGNVAGSMDIESQNRVWVVNCYFGDTDSGHHIFFNGADAYNDIFILGNGFRAWSATKAAIQLKGNIANGIIANNIIDGSTSGGYGIYDDSYTYMRLKIIDNIITGCSVSNADLTSGTYVECDISRNIGYTTTEIIHAEIHDEDNTDAFVINDAGGDFHSYHTNGLAAGDLADWTFDAGGAGTSHAIMSIVDGTPSGTDIAVSTSTSHGLAVGDIISQTNLTDAAYVGVFEVKDITSANIYEVAAVYTATGTGTMDQAATLEADAVAAGVYSFSYCISATLVGNNETFDFQLYKEATAITGSKVRRKFGVANDFGSNAGCGVISIASGDKISLALSNEDSADNIIFRNLTIVLIRL